MAIGYTVAEPPGRRISRGARFRNRRLRVEELESRQLLSASGDESPAVVTAENEAKISEFKAYFDEVMAQEHVRFLGMSLRGGDDSVNLYNLQLALDGVISMYEATGDRAVLDTAMLYSENVVNSARVIEDGVHEVDGYLDWEALSGGRPMAARQGLLLNDLQIGSPLSRLGRIIASDDGLQDDADVQQFGQELTQFVDQHIIHKWLDVRNQREWLTEFHDRNGFWIDRATHTVSICHNLATTLGEDSSCAGVEEGLARQFRDLLVLQEDGSYLWDNHAALPAGNSHPVPDTAHANRAATMLAQLGEDEFVFDRLDVLRLSKTFTERIWNGRTDWEDVPGVQESPWFHNYIDGHDSLYRSYERSEGPEGMDGFVYDGWVRLGQYDPEVQRAGESLLGFIRAFPNSVNAIRQRNGSPFGKVALAGHLARNLRLEKPLWDAPSSAADVVSQQVPGADETAYIATESPSVPHGPAAIPGDADGDGRVLFSDFLVLAGNLGRTDAVGTDGDFNRDGVVNMLDFAVFAASFDAAPRRFATVRSVAAEHREGVPASEFDPPSALAVDSVFGDLGG